MAIDEADRHALHDHFISQIGEHLAGELMHELIHEVDWGEFATKHDLRAEIADVRHDVAVLQRDVAALRHDMLALEVRLNERLDDKLGVLRGELRTEMADLRTEMHKGFRRQTLALAGMMAAGWGAVAAFFGLG